MRGGWAWAGLAVATAMIVFVIGRSTCGAELLVQHVHPGAGQPDPYTGYKRPGSTVSCCGGKDCRPVESRFNFEFGQTELLIRTEWRALEHDKIVGPPPPGADQHVIHACWQDRSGGPGPLLCIFLSGGV